MTDTEVKALKPGDKLSYYCTHCASAVADDIDTIVARGTYYEHRYERSTPHAWATVKMARSGRVVTIESDEYIKSFGVQTHRDSTRIAGADLLPSVAHAMMNWWGNKP